MCSNRVRPNERGAVLVELAFALPILALIFLSIVDLGLVVREYQLLQNAAREGAHFSSLGPNQIYFSSDPCGTWNAIRQTVVNYAAEERITVNTGNITVDQTYDYSQVTVTYGRSLLLRGAPYLPLGTITLKASSVFHNLYGGAGTTFPAGVTCP